MANERNRSRFSVKGGGLLKSAVVASGGALTTMDDLGYLESTDFTVDRKMIEYTDESGSLVNVVSGGEDWRIKTVLMQVGIDEINLILSQGAAYRHFYYCAYLDMLAKYQEIYIPLGRIISPLNLSFKAGEKRNIPIEIVALMPKGAVTVTPAGLNVPAGAYGVIVETATTALGQVTTSTGTIYTAAV
jgi:hypothetical protein